jgi:hypothetical protein
MPALYSVKCATTCRNEGQLTFVGQNLRIMPAPKKPELTFVAFVRYDNTGGGYKLKKCLPMGWCPCSTAQILIALDPTSSGTGSASASFVISIDFR